MHALNEPVTLRNEHVQLELLGPVHHDELCDAVLDGELWKLTFTIIPDPEHMHAEIERRLRLRRDGSMLPFAVRRASDGKVVGMTTYMNIDNAHRRVEIGSTWYAASAQRTALNTACKLLLLTHAFETLDVIAVEFRTSTLNTRSQRAIERIGAKQDGILRNHMRMPNGAVRDTCVYSILPAEWPAVKQNLLSKLGASSV
ncbi:MAG TPA: GNAT family protein [Flavobacteriales bacterium]|nr:GNAT family protein [Flavobacteriales bacterium]